MRSAPARTAAAWPVAGSAKPTDPARPSLRNCLREQSIVYMVLQRAGRSAHFLDSSLTGGAVREISDRPRPVGEYSPQIFRTDATGCVITPAAVWNVAC